MLRCKFAISKLFFFFPIYVCKFWLYPFDYIKNENAFLYLDQALWFEAALEGLKLLSIRCCVLATERNPHNWACFIAFCAYPWIILAPKNTAIIFYSDIALILHWTPKWASARKQHILPESSEDQLLSAWDFEHAKGCCVWMQGSDP